MRRCMALMAMVAALPLGACGGSTSPSDSATPAPTPIVAIVPDPSPAAAGPSSDPGYQWSTSFTLTLTETAGVAVSIRSLSANLQQASGGGAVTPPAGLAEAFRFQVRAPANRLEANGRMALGMSFFYTLPQPGQEALVTVTFTLIDDLGNLYPQAVQVRVV
jgi:hypothetical protein